MEVVHHTTGKHTPLTSRRARRGLFFALAVLSAVLLTAQGLHPAQSQAPAAAVTTPSRFGAVESYYRPDDAVEAGIGWERIIFEWRYLQPDNADQWDTSHISDQWLESAKKGGRTVVALLKNAPHWATGSDLLGAPPKGLDLPIDNPKNYWAAFVMRVVRYYSEKWDIHHWIIYNEPDIRPENTNFFEFAGEVEDYYKVLKVAYKAAHAADPKAVIHLAGLTFWQDVVNNRDLYLERLLRLAAKDPEARKNKLFFDVMTVHVFSGTSWVERITRQSKSLPESFGFPHPVWIDEMNVRVTSDGDWHLRGKDPDMSEVSLDEQASFIIQGSALGLALGVEKIAVYRLFDNDVSDGFEAWGLVRGDGTRRPGYYALKTVIKYFSDITRADRFSQNGVSAVLLRNQTQTYYVVWNETNQPVKVRIKAVNDRVDGTVISPTGDESKVPAVPQAGGSYDLTLDPCKDPCAVQGKPQILVQPGLPQAIWVMSNDKPVRLN